MKRLFFIAIFACAAATAFAQYTHTVYAPNGTKVEEGQYSADPGVLSTDSKEIAAQKMAAVHKTGTWNYWYDNGQPLAEEQYTASGAPTGTWKNWHDNGQLSAEHNRVTGAVVYYHPNGAKAEEGTINAANVRTGAWKGWHANGKLNFTGAYTATGEKHGAWNFFDTTEKPVATEQ